MKSILKGMTEKILKILYRFNIYKRLLIVFILAFIVPILVIGVFRAFHSFSTNRDEARQFLEESSDQIAGNINDYVYYHSNLIELVADNQEIIEDLKIYEEMNWEQKSETENYIRLVLGHTFGAASTFNACELITKKQSYFYYPSPVSNGDFASSEILSEDYKEVELIVDKKEIPTDRETYIIFARSLYDENEICIGNIVAAIDMSYLNKACFKNVSNLSNEVMIIDDKGFIVSASDDQKIGLEFQEERFKTISVLKKIPETNLTIVNQIQLSVLFRSAFINLVFTLSIALILAVVALFVAVMLTRSFSMPINRLIEEMNKDEMYKHVYDEGRDGYNHVILGFNAMNDNIVEAVRSQYENKLEESQLKELKKEAELSALQQQINPHFLYNTLESIYWSGQLEGDEEISEIVNALGNYLRVIIDKGREYVTIADEVESVNNYLFLQNKRFGGRIHYNWTVPDHVKDTRILKLAIHPVVEDVIGANLDDIEAEIRLEIRIEVSPDTVEVILTDQAVTYYKYATKRNEERHQPMKGISSVGERLSLYFGSEYGVFIISDPDCILIRIPVYHTQENKGRV